MPESGAGAKPRRGAGALALATALLPAWSCLPLRAGAAEFETAHVRFEQNATDGDVEVVFEVKGGDAGLVRLRLESPDGRIVADFRAPDASTLGIREFQLESPEPADVEALKAAYPEGRYRFSGTAADGEELRGEAALRHQLPEPVTLLAPAPNARDVGVADLQIAWAPVAGAAGYIVEIEQDELDANLSARLPGSQARFRVPEGFLVRDTEYELSLGSVSEAGNVSFAEWSFSTQK